MGLIASVAAGCERAPVGSGASSTGGGEPPGVARVVATTGMVADAAREVGGGAVRVTALMGPGVDPHLYKASPGDLRVLGEADVVLYNGLHLEGKLADVLQQLSTKQPCVAVGGAIPTASLRDVGNGAHDPHVWFDVSLWAHAVRAAEGALAAASPTRAAEIHARGEAYAARLALLHEWCQARIATIPESRRVLVTSHDAFGYFGRAYNLRVLAIQGISTESEASLKDVNALVDLLVQSQVPAVFVESSVPTKTIESLIEGAKARGHAVTVGGELFSDAMGEEGTFEGTYVGMVVHNVRSIVRALGGVDAEPPTGVMAGSRSGEAVVRPEGSR